MIKSVVSIITKQKAFLAVVVMFIIMLFFPTNFYTQYNLLDMLNSASILMIIAFGVTFTLIGGACDLSVGGNMVLAGIIVVKLLEHLPIWASILIAVALGGIIGLVNGYLSVYHKTEPFIITLGMGTLLTGIAQQITDAHPVPCSNMAFMRIANSQILNVVPTLVVIMLAVLLFTYWLLRFTQFGRNLYAVGGDYEVAKYSGINVRRTKAIAFVLSGIFAALGGILLASKLNTGASTYGDTTALEVNCGVVVGGTSFAGGIGGIPQSAIGMLVFAVLENAMNMLNIDAYVQMLFKGIVIVAIIWLDCYTRKRKREAV
ncbi:MAG: ABC transporter permease [Clostridiales bacterium]|jgi:ribose transport system permease protein|nr:ABC transporter permease [Clostridiales bacterium]